MYRVARKRANLIEVSLATAAILAICVLTLAETTNAAKAENSLPQNGKIAFADVQSGGSTAIYTVEPDGSKRERLTDGTYNDLGPIWSPDGTEIAFSRQGSRGGDISVISADGSNLRELNASGTWSSGPTWSPEGTKLAFASNVPPNNYNDIFMMGPDGSNQINLTKSTLLDESSPVFSPNGAQMCFSQYNPNAPKPPAGIYLMDADGSDPTLLAEGASGGGCDWSPDGTKIAFSAARDPDARGGNKYQRAVEKALDEGDLQKAQEVLEKQRARFESFHSYEEVYVIGVDGSGKTKLTSNLATDINPRWSPDGKKIIFESDRDGNPAIYTMDADGSDAVRVTKDLSVTESNPDWQPLPGPTPSKDADGSDRAQGTKKPAVEDVDRDRPERTVIVKPGDSLWSISEQRLGPEASPQRVYEHTYQMYALNRERIGSDPDLIFVGQRLSLPPLGEG